ncbi:hypothetical protein ACWCQW_45430 [Streptomyces mirabilis]
MIARHFDEEDLAMATPTPPPFDRAKLESEVTSMWKEARKYGLHHDEQFKTAFEGYIDQLRQNGGDLNRGEAPQAGNAAEKLIEQFDRLNAFHVPAKWYRDTYKDLSGKHGRYSESLESEFAGARAKKASETGKYLWSKTEPYYPAREAAKAGDMILETSVPGKILNGKTGGVKNWSDAPVQERIWQLMSGHYVDGAHGPVTGVMLEGRVAGSVLTKYEWPRLKELIKAGKVPHLHVKLMGIKGDKRNSETWSLTTKESFNVHSQGSFDRIPSPDSDFKENQARWRNKELERHAARSKSSSPSSSSDGSSSSNHSLDNFHKVFDDPDAVVVLWDPYAGDAQFTESPKALSRSGSGEFPQASTEGVTGEERRQATIAAVQGELAAEAQGKYSMDRKIENFTAEQAERRAAGSTSAWRSVYYDHRLAESVSHMDLGSSSDERSPLKGSPGVRLGSETASYFSPGAAAGGTEHYDSPPSPVHDARAYNPSSGDPQNRVASTGSDSSGGVPLRKDSTSRQSDSSGGVPLRKDSTSTQSDSSGGVPLPQDSGPGEPKPKGKNTNKPSTMKGFAGQTPGRRR